MKRIFLILILLLCSLILVACNEQEQEQEEENKGEYVIMDSNLEVKNQNDDNYRVFYEIFSGSFSDANGDGKGDLQGIINRLDYLNDGDPNSGKSLGIEGIWLTPIFKSPSYHRYDVTDYYQIDPALGTMDDLKVLIDECHKRDIKLILDLVINHTGKDNSWFIKFKIAHENNNTEDKYYDYYTYFKQGDTKPNGTFSPVGKSDSYYECNFSTDMPELNFDNEEVRQEVLKIAKYYLDMGIDGFRFDAAKYIYFGNDKKSGEFWNWYISELKKINPNVYIVGEVWDNDSIVDVYQQNGLNCFNFNLSEVNGYIASTAKGKTAVSTYTNYIENYLNKIKGYNNDGILHQFISNHDMDRAAGYLTPASGEGQMAASIYLLSPGSPFIYYGEEIGIKGIRGGYSTDANRRLAMLWGDGDTVKDPFEATYKPKNQINGTVATHIVEKTSLYNHYKKLIMIRKAYPEIARGEFVSLDLDTSKVGGFISTYNGSSVCVLHNTSKEAITIDLSTLDAKTFNTLCVYVGLNDAKLDGTSLTIGGQTSVVLK